MSVICLQLYRLDLLPVSLSGKLYFFSICNISLIKMYKPDDLLVAKKLFNAVFIYRKRALFKWKNLIPYICNIFGVKYKTTLFSHQSLSQPFFGMPRNVPHKVSLRGALHDIPKNGCEGDYLVIGCHLTVVSGFSHFLKFPSVCRSSFAMEGADCKVNEDVAKSIKDFHAAKKPIG